MTGMATTAMSGATPPRAFFIKRANMRHHPLVVETTYEQEFLHMGVPPLKKRERYTANLGETRFNLPANGLRSFKQ
jgi:hypothetical protein